MTDPYANKAHLGAMVRDAAKAAVHNTDGPNDPDLQRLNNILVCEEFMAALVASGCMITRIPVPLAEVTPSATATARERGERVDYMSR